MSEDLLLELEPTIPVTGSLENIEDLLRVVTREVGWAAEGMKGSALAFENAWRHIIANVAKGQTTEMQAARPRLLSALEKRFNLLKQTHALIACLQKLGRADLSWASCLVSSLQTRPCSVEILASRLPLGLPLGHGLLTVPQRRPKVSRYGSQLTKGRGEVPRFSTLFLPTAISRYASRRPIFGFSSFFLRDAMPQ